jgi:putative ATP-dependent endonuclease of OLD family
MYLEKFTIRNFRSIENLSITFNKGVNIIIGENNAGKSAIIDALRICLSQGKQWRDIGIRNEEDFHIKGSEISDDLPPIEFGLQFKIENDEDRHFFNSMVWQNPADTTDQNIQLHFRYYLVSNPKGLKNLKWKIWGANLEGNVPDSNELQLIFYTYLAPLRNAEMELKPYARENKVTSLFRELTKYQTTVDGLTVDKELSKAEKALLAGKLQTVIEAEGWSDLIKTGEKFLNDHLELADIRNKGSKVHLKLIEYQYDNIIKGMLTRKPVYASELLVGDNSDKQRFFDVSQNGLGENNLIYASAVLGDLKNRRDEKKEHYYALLIEEPEAHLHPQKQNTFFKYLNNLQDLGIQIFITSHSPTITAKSDLNHLIVLQKQPAITSTFTVRQSALSDNNKIFLRKFLDVTKSQLFFSNATMLVEGISEALLMPVFAKMVNEEFDLDRNGIEVVNINGVAFEPFAKLYNSVTAEQRLPSRCVLLTDNDQGQINHTHFIDEGAGITTKIAKEIYADLYATAIIDQNNRVYYVAPFPTLNLGANAQFAPHVTQVLKDRTLAVADRAKKAKTLIGGNLHVELSSYTFEYELICASDANWRLVLGVYKQMHPKTKFLDKTHSLHARAFQFLEKLDSNKDKSVLAENLAFLLEKRFQKTAFKVPDYIQKAINHILK